ncbi:MAG: YbbR-like domain-containing protein, partial [bacterium]|nr:YbbR-like domain-containing protein [bacterium]
MTVKNFFTENLGLKLFSLLAAMLLEFYFFSPDNTVSIEMQIAIELQNTPSERVIVSPTGAQRGLFSKVELVGPHHLIESVKSSPPVFRIVLPDSPPSELHFQLRREDLRLPNGVQVKGIEPSTYRLEFDRLIRRELKVQLDTVGEAAAGYHVKSLKVFPETVFARGPSGELEGRQSVSSLPLDISNMQNSDRLDVSLTDVGKLTSLEVNLVSVQVEIEAIPLEKEYKDIA